MRKSNCKASLLRAAAHERGPGARFASLVHYIKQFAPKLFRHKPGKTGHSCGAERGGAVALEENCSHMVCITKGYICTLPPITFKHKAPLKTGTHPSHDPRPKSSLRADLPDRADYRRKTPRRNAMTLLAGLKRFMHPMPTCASYLQSMVMTTLHPSAHSSAAVPQTQIVKP